jgi:hypothetical protein
MAEPRFLDFLDRIDGGGKGQSGDTFEGGGLLSLLGNLLASPYGSQNPERRARRDAFYAGEPMAASGFNPPPARDSQYSERGSVGMPQASSPARDPYDMQENRYLQYGGRGDVGMPVTQNPRLADFNRMMETLPQGLGPTELGQQYRDFLLSGGNLPYGNYIQSLYSQGATQ